MILYYYNGALLPQIPNISGYKIISEYGDGYYLWISGYYFYEATISGNIGVRTDYSFTTYYTNGREEWKELPQKELDQNYLLTSFAEMDNLVWTSNNIRMFKETEENKGSITTTTII